MTRAEAWAHFIETYAKVYSREMLFRLEDDYWLHRDDFVPEFLESFRQICLKIHAMQSQNEKAKIRFITYSILWTGFIEHQPAYLGEAFDRDWFLDFAECHAKYYPVWAFRHLFQLETELTEKAKLYLGQINRSQLERYLLQEAKKYHQYVIRFIRYAMPQAIRLPEFQMIAKESKFTVGVGEYLHRSEIVYLEDLQVKEPTITKNWLQSNDGLAYSYEVFRNLDLSQGDYWGINLKYADLQGSDLSQSQMQFCTLTGAKLNHGSLAESNLSEALIFEADFEQCDLRGADFSKANGGAGLNEGQDWNNPGFGAVNFRKANLEGANFRDANLCGAVFSEANLVNVDFGGAVLTSAVFLKADLEHLKLSQEQREQIVWQ